MNKDQLLQELSSKINTGEISRDEVINRLGFAPSVSATTVNAINEVKNKVSSSFSVTKLLYILGGIIAVVGIVLFAYQIWPDIGSVGRIAITLGMGLLMTVIGFFMPNTVLEGMKDSIGSVFYFIGGVLVPIGTVVTVYELNTGFTSPTPYAFGFGIVFLFYLFINYIYKNPILTFFSIANGTAFIYLTVNAMTDGLVGDYTDLYTYITMVIGAVYMLLAYSFRDGWNERLASLLYAFGFIGIEFAILNQYSRSGYRDSLWPIVFSLGLSFVFYLFLNFYVKKTLLTLLAIINGTAFIYVFVQALIGGSFYQHADLYAYLTMVIGAVYLLLSYSFRGQQEEKLVGILNFFGVLGLLGAAFSRIYDSTLWLMFFPILVFGGFMFSIYSRSRIVLILSTLFLLSYISYVTGKYFADSIGWPITLVILGFLFIGFGYLSISINRKYMTKS